MQKKIEIIPWILTDHNGIKLEIDSKDTKTIQIHGDWKTHFWTITGLLKTSGKKWRNS
jgi:hypothetical protein